jgi:hypothetical protein
MFLLPLCPVYGLGALAIAALSHKLSAPQPVVAAIGVTAGRAVRALPVLGLMAVTVTAWLPVARGLLVEVGWLATGREVALVVWAVGASAGAGLVRHTLRTCPWHQLWQHLARLKVRRALVVPALVGLLDLVLAVVDHPWRDGGLAVVLLMLLVAYQLWVLSGWAGGLLRQRLEAGRTRAV